MTTSARSGGAPSAAARTAGPSPTGSRDAARRLGAAPDPALLDPAERMGVDELRALQLERLRASLRHA